VNTIKKWNSKHKQRLNQSKEPQPNIRLMNMAGYLHGGTALDLACGLGANSLFLASRNFEVKSIDISEVAIAYIKEQAEKYNLKITPQVCDLTIWSKSSLRNQTYDLIVITYYLDWTLFPIVKNLIKDRGYLFIETFYKSIRTENEGISDKYKLHSGELLNEFGDWKVLFFEEDEQEGRQTIFCKKPERWV
jgi:tellurite methyltransferase